MLITVLAQFSWPVFLGLQCLLCCHLQLPTRLLTSSPDQNAPLLRTCTGVLVVALAELVTSLQSTRFKRLLSLNQQVCEFPIKAVS